MPDQPTFHFVLVIAPLTRSVEKDLETQIVVVTSNEELRDRLQRERDDLFKHGTLVNAQTWGEPGRAVPWWVSRVVGIARNFF